MNNSHDDDDDDDGDCPVKSDTHNVVVSLKAVANFRGKNFERERETSRENQRERGGENQKKKK